MKITARLAQDFTWLFVEAKGNQPDRTDIFHLKNLYPSVEGYKGVILVTGNLPGWFTAGVVAHYKNLCRWLAWYDPSEKGAIVFHSVSTDHNIGHFIPLNLPCLICKKELKAGAKYPYCKEHEDSGLHRYRYKKAK